MYTSFYGMNCNPFLKDESIKDNYNSQDFKETISRFNYLKEVKGIGLFTGSSGLGKTYAARTFINQLNPELYKVIYINISPNMSLFDFFKIITDALYLEIGACYRTDIYNNIQKEIMRIVKQDKMDVIIIIDNAHLLSREILMNFKVLYDFEMDSKDYVTLILIGYPDLKIELSKKIYETLSQRIIVNYEFEGLSKEEVNEYVKTRLKISGANPEIFEPDALYALYSCSTRSPRKLNTLVLNSLMIGAQNGKTKINSEIIMNAKKEMDLN